MTMLSPDRRLDVRGVSKTYTSGPDDGAVGAIVDATFHVDAGEAVGLVGPNGAGKSTMLKVIAGVTAPSAGIVHRARSTVAVIELGSGLHPDLTGRENIELLAALALEDRPRPASFLAEVIDFSGLDSALEEPVRHYSTGMVARLAFSVAAHAGPDLLLLDEVLSVGDLTFQQRCRDKVVDLRSRGTAIVLVSHDLGLVNALCERSLLMVGGAIVLDGTTEEVMAEYVGHPRTVVDTSLLSLQVDRPSTPAGEPLAVSLELDAGGADRPTDVLIEYVRPTHEAVHSTRGPSIVCAQLAVTLEPERRRTLALQTRDLPAGRYVLRASVLDAGGRVQGSVERPFALTGTPGPAAVNLRASVVVDSRHVQVSGS